MKNEYEVIEHANLSDLNMFLVEIDYRTPHFHEDIEIIQVLEGSVISNTMHQEIHLEAGSTVIYNSFQPHEFHSAKQGTLILCTQVAPRFCAHYYPAISNVNFDCQLIEQHLPEDLYSQLKIIMTEMAWQYFSHAAAFEFSCVSMLNQLFSILIRHLPYHILTEDEKKSNQQKIERLSRILNYIEENYTEKTLLSDIARREKISMTYLSHFFKDNLNQTFQEYLSNLRFTRARELVASGKMKLIDVCLECGFSDYRYLYKAFLKNSGCTPREYQKQNRSIPPERKIFSSESSQIFYTVENTAHILENLHRQNQAHIDVLQGFTID